MVVSRVRSAPIAYRSEGGIRVEYGNTIGLPVGGGSFWLSYVDAFLLFQDLRSALKGMNVVIVPDDADLSVARTLAENAGATP